MRMKMKSATTPLILAMLLSASLATSWIGASEATAQSIPNTLGWNQLANTQMRSVCPSILSGSCQNVTAAWSSGAFDTKRNRLIIFGGGHTDYVGNELYSLNLSNLTINRLTDPGQPFATACQAAIAGGTQPNSRHTYDGLVYIAAQDQLFVFGGSLACGSGTFGTDTWTYNFASSSWQQRTPAGPTPAANPGAVASYDPVTQLVFLQDRRQLFSFNSATNTYTALSGDNCCDIRNYSQTSVIDPKRRMMVIIGQGDAYIYDISGTGSYQQQNLVTTGGAAIVNQDYPGLAYDPVTDRIVAWIGGNIVYSLNLDTRAWTSVTYAGGPSAMPNGTFKRWTYSAASGVFVVLNSVDTNASTFRLSSGVADSTAPSIPTGAAAVPVSSTQIDLSWSAATDNVSVAGYRVYRGGTLLGTTATPNYSSTGLTPSTSYSFTVSAYDGAGNDSAQSTAVSASTLTASTSSGDFQTRCSAAGVLVCMGWDSASDVVPATWPNSGIYPGDDGQFHGGFDTNTKASGVGSLRLDVLSKSSSNGPGDWRQLFGQDFGQNSTFYVQFRQRFSPEMLNINWYGLMGTTWKQNIIYNMGAPSCVDFSLVTAQSYNEGIPIMYTECGARGLWTNNGIPPYLLQQGDYNCPYGSVSSTVDCFHYVPNEWLTFYYRVSIGTWGSANSTIEAWVGREGQPLKKWVSMPNFKILNSGTAIPFNAISLNAYMTAKDTSVAHATASTWFDELIISRQPIVAPGGGGTINPPPAAPTNLRVQ